MGAHVGIACLQPPRTKVQVGYGGGYGSGRVVRFAAAGAGGEVKWQAETGGKAGVLSMLMRFRLQAYAAFQPRAVRAAPVCGVIHRLRHVNNNGRGRGCSNKSCINTITQRREFRLPFTASPTYRGIVREQLNNGPV